MSVFSKIAKGEIPSYKIAEDENYFAFLDINPLAKGHTLVIPKKETDYLFDIDDELYKGLWLFAKKIAIAIDRVMKNEKGYKRVGIAVIGLEVAHAHIHLIPLYGALDIDFSRPKLKLSDQEFKDIQKKITLSLKD